MRLASALVGGELANPNNAGMGSRKRWGSFLTPTYLFT